MNRNCRCGGRLVPQTGTAERAWFKCDKCGGMHDQRKRQPAKIDTDEVRAFLDRNARYAGEPATVIKARVVRQALGKVSQELDADGNEDAGGALAKFCSLAPEYALLRIAGLLK